MKFHPDILAAHAQFGGDLEDMQRRYDETFSKRSPPMSDGKLRALIEEMRAGLEPFAYEANHYAKRDTGPARIDMGCSETRETEYTIEDLHRASRLLTAAASHLSTSSNEGWRVKPLEWGSITNLGMTRIGSGVTGEYVAGPDTLECERFTVDTPDGRSIDGGRCWDDAIIAAQADYEARIRSAILPPPPSPGEEQTPQSMEQGR